MTGNLIYFALAVTIFGALIFAYPILQLLAVLRAVAVHLFHIAEVQRQQIIELQVLTAALSSLAGAIESYLEQTEILPAKVRPPESS